MYTADPVNWFAITHKALQLNVLRSSSKVKTNFRPGGRTVSAFLFSSPPMSASEPKMPPDTENQETLSKDSGEKDVTVLYNPHMDVSGIDEAKLVRKIDWRLVPWLSFLYLLSFLDRASIGNARVCSQIHSL